MTDQTSAWRPMMEAPKEGEIRLLFPHPNGTVEKVGYWDADPAGDGTVRPHWRSPGLDIGYCLKHPPLGWRPR